MKTNYELQEETMQLIHEEMERQGIAHTYEEHQLSSYQDGRDSHKAHFIFYKSIKHPKHRNCIRTHKGTEIHLQLLERFLKNLQA